MFVCLAVVPTAEGKKPALGESAKPALEPRPANPAKAPANPAATPTLPLPAEPALPAAPRPEPGPGAWLGCILTKPEPSAMAQVPSLPQGVGLVVRGMSAGGPAEAAKLEAMDVLWKFDTQLLVNQSQLAVLLNLRQPGEEVTLSLFRGGESIDIKVKLGAPPPGSAERIFPDDGSFYGPRIVIEKIPGTRTASTTTPRGRVVMEREDKGYRVTIRDSAGKQTFTKVFPPEGRWEGVPDGWNRTLWVLRRSLDHSTENGMTIVRPPRPRVVPPADGGETADDRR